MSAPVLETVRWTPEDESLVTRLADDIPTGSRSEAAVIDWLEAELSNRPSGTSPSLPRVLDAVAARADVIRLTGLHLPADLPGTPSAITAPDTTRHARHDVAHLVVAAHIGAVYGCVHTQGGRLANDIIAVPGASANTAQSARGFRFHVDGAMDPETAPQYFSMQCMRNTEQVPTFASSVRREDFDAETWSALTEPVFTIRFDPNRAQPTDVTNTPVIVAGPDETVRELRYYDDADRLRVEHRDPEPFLRAVAAMGEVLNRDVVDITLEPGDILIVNNRTTVHGRRGSVSPVDNPRDRRWMRRLWISTDDDQIHRVRAAPGRVLDSMRGPR